MIAVTCHDDRVRASLLLQVLLCSRQLNSLKSIHRVVVEIITITIILIIIVTTVVDGHDHLSSESRVT